MLVARKGKNKMRQCTFVCYTSFYSMETASVELDNLLVSILQDCYQYISLKKEFYDIFSDVSIWCCVNT